MNAIEQWKANGMPYNDGVLLYASLPKHNKMLLKNFQKKQSNQLHEKLKYELSKVDKSEKTTPKPVIRQIVSGQNVSKNTVVQYIEQQQINYTTKQALYLHELPA